MRKIYNVAVNDSDYTTSIYEDLVKVEDKRVRKRVWVCPFYERWCNMIKRCYSKVYQAKQPTYIGCIVCTEWLTFSNFKKWMETQNWEGRHLDKDLLGDGDLYSPNTCVFVSRLINNFLNTNSGRRGACMLGVSFHKASRKYQAECTNPLEDAASFLGYFDTEIEAHKAWQAKKHEYALRLADEQDDHRVAKVLRERYAPNKDWTKI